MKSHSFTDHKTFRRFLLLSCVSHKVKVTKNREVEYLRKGPETINREVEYLRKGPDTKNREVEYLRKGPDTINREVEYLRKGPDTELLKEKT